MEMVVVMWERRVDLVGVEWLDERIELMALRVSWKRSLD